MLRLKNLLFAIVIAVVLGGFLYFVFYLQQPREVADYFEMEHEADAYEEEEYLLAEVRLADEAFAGFINISYGLNEADAWEVFANDPGMQEMHAKARSEFIRVWVSCQWFLNPTFPLKEDGRYDFANLDSFIDAVLNANATPYVVFANSIEYCGGEGHGFPPPEDEGAFADYVEDVVRHYNGRHDISSWYFEVWNEPFHDDWWEGSPSRYSEVFNLVYSRIKSVSPESRVGGYTGGYFEGNWFNYRAEDFLENTDADFVSLHHFGNTANAETDEERMGDIGLLYYDSMKDLRELAAAYGKGDIEIINSEFSSDNTAEYMERLDEPFTAAWYASALIALIKSQEVSMELFYGGTSIFEQGGFGMWSVVGEPYPSFEMKRYFVRYNKRGSEIIGLEYNRSLADAFGARNDEGVFFTFVNKMDEGIRLNVDVSELGKENLSGINNDMAFNASEEAEISLEPYEVLFFELH